VGHWRTENNRQLTQVFVLFAVLRFPATSQAGRLKSPQVAQRRGVATSACTPSTSELMTVSNKINALTSVPSTNTPTCTVVGSAPAQRERPATPKVTSGG
jgi:hypothetical protein